MLGVVVLMPYSEETCAQSSVRNVLHVALGPGALGVGGGGVVKNRIRMTNYGSLPGSNGLVKKMDFVLKSESSHLSVLK